MLERVRVTGAKRKREHRSARADSPFPRCDSAKLIHGVVFTGGLQRCIAGEVLLVVIAHVGARHVLVFHASDALTDLLTLYPRDVTQHARLTEVLLGEVIGGQRRRVIGGQRDEVMENTRLPGRIALERLDTRIGL